MHTPKNPPRTPLCYPQRPPANPQEAGPSPHSIRQPQAARWCIAPRLENRANLYFDRTYCTYQYLYAAAEARDTSRWSGKESKKEREQERKTEDKGRIPEGYLPYLLIHTLMEKYAPKSVKPATVKDKRLPGARCRFILPWFWGGERYMASCCAAVDRLSWVALWRIWCPRGKGNRREENNFWIFVSLERSALEK